MSKKVAEQLVETLVQSGVKRIYAVTGDSLNEVNDAVRQNGGIEWIHVRHEETGAYAAAAEAQLNGNLACCAGSCGPGHVHLINGLYDAHHSGVPVLAIASTCSTHQFGTGYFQETDTKKLFDDCSCYNQIACTPHQFPRMLQMAIQHAMSLKGVSVIGLPGDLSAMEAEPVLSSENMFLPRPILRPSDEELKALAELLNQNEKITVFCGVGCGPAHEELVQLSKILNAPVGYSFKSKMEIQHDNPNEVGMTGLLGLPSAYKSMHEADVVLLLGTDFPYENFMPVKNKLVQIDCRPERLGRRAKLYMGLCGNIKDTLTNLLPLLSQKESCAFLNSQLALYTRVKHDLSHYVKDKGRENCIHPEYVASEIDRIASHDAIFTLDTGMCCVWGARYLNATGKRQMLGSFNHGSMANALAQSIGASLAYPDRQVIALCGDGGLSMLMGDLATIKQYALPIKIIVFNNRSLGMVKLEMEVAGLPDWQTNMLNPDFALLAQAFGIRGLTVSNPEQVSSVLQDELNKKEPVLISVMTDPNALAMPPKITFNQMKGFAVSMTKLMLGGEAGEVFDTIRSNYRHLRELF